MEKEKNKFIEKAISIGFEKSIIEQLISPHMDKGNKENLPLNLFSSKIKLSKNSGGNHIKYSNISQSNITNKSYQENKINSSQDQQLYNSFKIKQNESHELIISDIDDQCNTMSLAAKDLNLLSELIGYLHNLQNINEKKPIYVEELQKEKWLLEEQKQQKNTQTNINIYKNSYKNKLSMSHQLNSIDQFNEFEEDKLNQSSSQYTKEKIIQLKLNPKEEIIYIKEDHNNVNSKWKQRQKDIYNKTQNFLRKLEEREIEFQRENYPEELFQKIQSGFLKIDKLKNNSEERGEEVKRGFGLHEDVYENDQNNLKKYYLSQSDSDENNSKDIFNSDDETFLKLETKQSESDEDNKIDELSLGSSNQLISSSSNSLI